MSDIARIADALNRIANSLDAIESALVLGAAKKLEITNPEEAKRLANRRMDYLYKEIKAKHYSFSKLVTGNERNHIKQAYFRAVATIRNRLCPSLPSDNPWNMCYLRTTDEALAAAASEYNPAEADWSTVGGPKRREALLKASAIAKLHGWKP